MEKKKKNWRRDYLDDFTADENGRYSYTGRSFSLDAGKMKTRRQLRLLGFLAFGSVFAAGCLPGTDSGGRFYILLPYLAAFACGGGCVWQALALGFSGEIRAYVFKRAGAALLFLPAAGFRAALLTAAAEAFAALYFRKGIFIFQLLYAGLMLLSAVFFGLSRRESKKFCVF
ncbi:MAG: hypothetical protein K6E30_06065 [Lachnospiraceae bacterium]|nr:hypothetical protein [Lachnospiraceae bacterium]